MKEYDRRKSILYICVEKQGLEKDLVNLIGSDLYAQLSRLGIIKKTWNKGCLGWKVTESGIRLGHFYREPTEAEKALGRFYHSLGI